MGVREDQVNEVSFSLKNWGQGCVRGEGEGMCVGKG